MSLSSRESNLLQHREALLQLTTQLVLMISERRVLGVRIQEMKREDTAHYSHFDPENEVLVFNQLKEEMKSLTIKELLGVSLIMEDQAMAMAPGSYPSWSSGVHLSEPSRELFTMINPLLLKATREEFFNRLKLNPDFSFLKQF